jgi:hypothetical protein
MPQYFQVARFSHSGILARDDEKKMARNGV